MSQPGSEQDPEQLKDEIARTREELGETIEALTHKVDPREQARAAARTAAQKAQQVGQRVQEVTPQPVLDAAGRVRDTVAPATDTARQKLRGHERQALFAALGVVVVLLVVRRIGRRD
jgi:Protein of unknown function (DUF3618)